MQNATINQINELILTYFQEEKTKQEYTKAKRDVYTKLNNLGSVILPVAIKKINDTCFTGKNPSFVNKDGEFKLIKHGNYVNTKPTSDEVRSWWSPDENYYSFCNGMCLVCGINGIYCIDFDAKHYDNQEEIDRKVKEIEDQYNHYILWIDKTPNQGYHIFVKLESKPDFTNFTTEIQGSHRGELLGEGRIAVINPTINFKNKGYTTIFSNLDKYEDVKSIKDISEIGIYPVKTIKKNQPLKLEHHTTKIDIDNIEEYNNHDPNSEISIADLVNCETKKVLQDDEVDIEDRSETLTKAVKEMMGWANFLKRNSVKHKDKIEDLIDTVIQRIGIEDKADRVLYSINFDDCQPARLSFESEEVIIKDLKKCSNNWMEEIANETQKRWDEIEEVINNYEDRGIQQALLTNLSKKYKMSLKNMMTEYRLSQRNTEEGEVIDLADLQAKEKTEIDWIIPGIIPNCSTIMLYAKPGIGKSTLAYSWVYSIATGQSWNNRQVEEGKVLIIQLEENEQTTLDRWASYSIPKGKVFIKQQWAFTLIESLRRDVKNCQPKLVIIDSLKAACRGLGVDENSSEIANIVYDLHQIAISYQISFIVIHHENKDGLVRGSSALDAAFDEIHRFYVPDGGSELDRVLEVCKTRQGDKSSSLLRGNLDNYLDWTYIEAVGDSETKDRQNLKDQIVDFLDKNIDSSYSAKEISDHLNLKDTSVKTTMSRLVKDKRIEKITKDHGNSQRVFYKSRLKGVKSVEVEDCTNEELISSLTLPTIDESGSDQLLA